MIGVGDTVVCVNTSEIGNDFAVSFCDDLVLGAVYRVAAVFADFDGEAVCSLVATKGVWLVARFRKVQPKTAPEHIERLKRIPSRQREDS